MVLLTAATPPWINPTNDSGAGTDGTVANAAFEANQRDAINDLLHSTTNPTIKPKSIIDEVVTARGNKASLDARLDVLMTDDGTLVIPATIPSMVEFQDGLGALNLVANDDFFVWPVVNGAPAYWTKTGLGTVNKASGLVGSGAQIGAHAAQTKLTQVLLTAANISGGSYAGLRSRYQVSFGCYVLSSGAGVTIGIDDGITVTSSPPHSGGGQWEWLSVTALVNSAASKLEVFLSNTSASVAPTFSGATAVFASKAPAKWIPCPRHYETVTLYLPGTLAAGTDKLIYSPHRPGIVRDVFIVAVTAPTGQALIVDVNTPNAAGSPTSMFTTRPQIAAAANRGTSQPDAATYERRCFTGIFGTTIAEGNSISVDIDQVGSGTAGADLFVQLRILTYLKALEGALNYNTI